MSSTCGTVLKRYLLLPFLFQLNPVVTYGATPNISLQNSHPGGVSSVAFSKNGGRLFSGGSNGKVKVWDVSSRKLIKELKPTFKVINKYMPVTSIAVSPDGKYVAGGTEVNMVEVWETSSWKSIALLETKRDEKSPNHNYFTFVNSIAFSPNSKYLATGGGEPVILWSSASWKIKNLWKAFFSNHSHRIFSRWKPSRIRGIAWQN